MPQEFTNFSVFIFSDILEKKSSQYVLSIRFINCLSRVDLSLKKFPDAEMAQIMFVLLAQQGMQFQCAYHHYGSGHIKTGLNKCKASEKTHQRLFSFTGEPRRRSTGRVLPSFSLQGSTMNWCHPSCLLPSAAQTKPSGKLRVNSWAEIYICHCQLLPHQEGLKLSTESPSLHVIFF